MTCNCIIDLPSVQITNDRPRIETSYNVLSYELQLFDATGKLILTTFSDVIDKVRLPSSPSTYFWNAKLKYSGTNDLEFQKTQSGKVVIVDY